MIDIELPTDHHGDIEYDRIDCCGLRGAIESLKERRRLNRRLHHDDSDLLDWLEEVLERANERGYCTHRSRR